MKITFQDIEFLIQSATGLAALTGNPLITVGGEAIARLLRIAHNAYKSGRDRGEWTEEEETKWDEVLFPQITSQPHWKDQ